MELANLMRECKLNLVVSHLFSSIRGIAGIIVTIYTNTSKAITNLLA